VSTLLTLPIIIPVFTATLCLFAWNSPRIQCRIGVIGMSLLLINCLAILIGVYQNGIQSVQLGNWMAPYGITFVADLFSAIMLTVSAFVGLCVTVFSLSTVDIARVRKGYYLFVHFMLMGVCGAFLTGDIFNLFVWFEVMLIASFVLMALGGERDQMEGAVKYLTLNLLSSVFFLSAVGILYGNFGTLNMADLALKANAGADPELMRLTSVLFFVAFGVKAGLFPLFFWLPASYHTPPVAISAIFAGLLTKVGMYSLIRVFTLIFDANDIFTNHLLVWIAGFTMVVGVLGAVAQFNIRRLLSFHIISQIGYAVMGLAIFTQWALAGAIYFLVHNIFAKTNLFLIAGATYDLRGTDYLKNMGGLYKKAPFLSLLFVISAFGLAGIPPLSGFFGKFLLIKAGLDAGYYVITAIALGVGILTLFSMTKIFAEAFWKDSPEKAPQGELQWSDTPAKRRGLYLPIIAMATAVLLMGVLAQPVIAICMAAGAQLMDPSLYIESVLSTEYIEHFHRAQR
jgi:multicomponent Na+:H+ antiporter subunit D